MNLGSLFNRQLTADVTQMIGEAVSSELQFAEDLLGRGISGLSIGDVRSYLELCTDQRLVTLGMPKHYESKNHSTS